MTESPGSAFPAARRYRRSDHWASGHLHPIEVIVDKRLSLAAPTLIIHRRCPRWCTSTYLDFGASMEQTHTLSSAISRWPSTWFGERVAGRSAVASSRSTAHRRTTETKMTRLDCAWADRWAPPISYMTGGERERRHVY